MKFTHYINSLPYALESTSRVIQEAIIRDFKKTRNTNACIHQKTEAK